MAGFKRIGHGRDALLERRQQAGAVVGGACDLVDLRGEAADLIGQLGERTVGRHMGGDAAQTDDGAFELLHRRRILGVERDEVDLARQLPHRFIDAD